MRTERTPRAIQKRLHCTPCSFCAGKQPVMRLLSSVKTMQNPQAVSLSANQRAKRFGFGLLHQQSKIAVRGVVLAAWHKGVHCVTGLLSTDSAARVLPRPLLFSTQQHAEAHMCAYVSVCVHKVGAGDSGQRACVHPRVPMCRRASRRAGWRVGEQAGSRE